MFWLDLILGLIGGIGIFLYGMHLTSKGMQKVAVSRMRNYISQITNKRLKGLFVGIIATFFLQSSTATSIIVVGLVSGSIITLWQAFGVILGSSIGTTLIVQVLAFEIMEYSALFVFVGAILIIFFNRGKLAYIGQAILGLGFLFFGIGLMSTSLAPLANQQEFLELMVHYENDVLTLFLISFLLTGLMHSSAATIVLAMSLIGTGALPFISSIPLVLGANLGSTIPVLISSLASSREGRKVALSYFLFKLIGILVFFAFLQPFQQWIIYLPGNIDRQIAHLHTLFNVCVALSLLPFTYYFAALLDKLFPAKDVEKGIFLDERLIELPDEALAQSNKEIVKLAKMIKEDMLSKIDGLFTDQTNFEDILKVERKVDQAYMVIQRYLLKIGQQDLTENQADFEVKQLYILNDLEHIGDISAEIAQIANKVKVREITFLEADLEQIRRMGKYVYASFTKSIKAYEENNFMHSREVIQQSADFIQMEKDLRFYHFNHLIENKEYNSILSATYLDVINHLLRINQHAVNISQTVIGII